MARVFLATERALGRQVVIKTLPDDAWSTSAAQRFHREILTAAQLQHANIVPVLTAGDAEGIPYFTMPWVDGASLRERMARGPVPVSEAVGILRDVARALSAAHARNIVHRDIKPENILLSSGAALVTDFGVAKALSLATQGPEGTGMMTAVGVSVGTLAYMAPEQIAADPSLDHRADIYAWGVVAYELLSGQRPFAQLTGTALTTAQLTQMPPVLKNVAPQVPAPLAALVMQCLAKAPADRPSTANELLSVLDLPSGESPAISQTQTRKYAAAVMALIIAANVIGWLWNKRAPSADERIVAVAPFRVGGAVPEAKYLREGLADVMVPQLQTIPDLSAASMRVMLDRWKRAAGSVEDDLDDEGARKVASAAGAGQLLIGEIVGTRDRLSVSARLLRVRDGKELASTRVEGSADSVSALATRLLTSLLSLRDGATQERLRSVLSAQPAAIASYLTGEQLFRRGRYGEAGVAFAEAYRVDTTFAIAALRISFTNGWSLDAGIPGPWLERAWTHRDRLSGTDSLLLISQVGETYPQPMPTRARVASMRSMAERANSAELWQLYGDHLFHSGWAAEEPDVLPRALDAFRKSEALDSSFTSALEHQAQIYLTLGDAPAARAALARQAALDSIGDFYRFNDFYIRAVTGNAAEKKRALDDFESRFPEGLLFGANAFSADGGTGFRPDISLMDSILARRTRRGDRSTEGGFGISLRDLEWNAGRPTRAVAAAANRSALSSVAEEVTAALLWDGDSAQAVRSAATLTAALRSKPSSSPDPEAAVARAALGMWSLANGDSATADRMRRELAAATPSPQRPWEAHEARMLEALLSAQIAVARRAPDARAQLQRVDSLLRDAPEIERRTRTTANFVLAAMYEATNDAPSALRVLGRRDGQTAYGMFNSDLHRRTARLAERIGDRERAIEALRQFIALREQAEPKLQPEVAAAREKLKQLEAQGGGK
jgi:serine/threonine-protein kinase